LLFILALGKVRLAEPERWERREELSFFFSFMEVKIGVNKTTWFGLQFLVLGILKDNLLAKLRLFFGLLAITPVCC